MQTLNIHMKPTVGVIYHYHTVPFSRFNGGWPNSHYRGCWQFYPLAVPLQDWETCNEYLCRLVYRMAGHNTRKVAVSLHLSETPPKWHKFISFKQTTVVCGTPLSPIHRPVRILTGQHQVYKMLLWDKCWETPIQWWRWKVEPFKNYTSNYSLIDYRI